MREIKLSKRIIIDCNTKNEQFQELRLGSFREFETQLNMNRLNCISELPKEHQLKINANVKKVAEYFLTDKIPELTDAFDKVFFEFIDFTLIVQSGSVGDINTYILELIFTTHSLNLHCTVGNSLICSSDAFKNYSPTTGNKLLGGKNISHTGNQMHNTFTIVLEDSVCISSIT